MMERVRHKSYTISPEQLKAWRTARKVSQRQVAKELGISQPAYLHLEKHGASHIHALAIAAIEHGLKAWTPPESPEPEGSQHDEQYPVPQA
ncbi:helix-turn-helix transcriptional regulator [Methylobacterium sp. E-045]|uniref:helix-turn-helix transcriptional regulator n=1 Tax=Methylobacterium sp. E-045 TaxID=2836575 RepID=UPI001FBA8922|nr:helix-turn-helix transcriptional regulator [Methylobacterium sp. E-045]MCJ2131597.1 helix-turn-helix domain-containing protein [Methylobacterium sp. E-045]